MNNIEETEIIDSEVNEVSDESIERANKKNNPLTKKIVMLVAIALLLSVILITAIVKLLGGKSGGNNRLVQQLDLGNKYLVECDYEQAIVAFTAVIDIDPENLEAYLGLIEAYIELNDYSAAYDWAKKGYELTGAEELKEKMDMIDSGQIYDALGRIHKMSGYDRDGKLTGYHIYSYNRDKQASVTRLDANEVKQYEVVNKFDDDGRLIYGYDGYLSESLKLRIGEFTYDENGQISSVNNYVEDGELEDTYNYTYNSEGQNVREDISYKEPGHRRIVEISYDENGRSIRRDITDINNGEESYSYSLFTYDEKGNVTSQKDYGSDGILFYRDVSEYDENGTLLRKISYNGNDEEIRRVEYK